MKFKAATLVFCVFLTGAVVGGLAVHVFGDRIWSTRASTNANSMPSRDELLQQLGQQLNLTSDQRAQIRAAMDQTVSDWHRIFLTVDPQLEQARQQGRQRIRGVLTPEQLPKYEEFMRHLDEQRARAEQHERQQKDQQQKDQNSKQDQPQNK
jgi:flagellar biosynthesis chaperone FliJ